MCFDFRLEMPFSSRGFKWCFLLWPGLGAAGLRESFAPLPLESWACFGLGLLSSVQRCWWGLMAPNHDYTFNAHYLVPSCNIGRAAAYWVGLDDLFNLDNCFGGLVPDSCHLSYEAIRLLSGLVFFPAVLEYFSSGLAEAFVSFVDVLLGQVFPLSLASLFLPDHASILPVALGFDWLLNHGLFVVFRLLT
ncbi:hypothetical protein POTOM_031775 [Populus tomentosa]|uniref:Uncharacterized protein n=1 Tax=Populus tomentosa TaxID=118781 RepID=A0A8X7Z8X3_POPTO|nr:hypothetical protein POTOM_031775 [Populus tomentosa]